MQASNTQIGRLNKKYNGYVQFTFLIYLLILFPAKEVNAQVFQKVSEDSEEFWGEFIAPSGHSAPYFFDIENDGDMDMLIGSKSGKIHLQINTGTEENARFYERDFFILFDDDDVKSTYFKSGFGKYSKLAGMDHDKDGDFDLFCGTEKSGIFYFHNTSGSSDECKLNIKIPNSPGNIVPKYVSKATHIAPAFVDINAWQHAEVIYGQKNGKFANFTIPSVGRSFNVEKTNLPSDLSYATPTFGDINGDGELDMVLGAKDGKIYYCPFMEFPDTNATGYVSMPYDLNPFRDIQVDSFSTPALVDIDSDGDLDLFVGAADGTLSQYENISVSDYLTVDNHHSVILNSNLTCNGSSVIYGNLGIGVLPTADRLTVNGRINAEDFNTQVIDPPDYVFAKDYDLRPLKEIQKYIDKHSHLPEIPSAATMESKGVLLGEMSMALLKKIEELTLYILEMDKKMEAQEVKLIQQERMIQKLQNTGH